MQFVTIWLVCWWQISHKKKKKESSKTWIASCKISEKVITFCCWCTFPSLESTHRHTNLFLTSDLQPMLLLFDLLTPLTSQFSSDTNLFTQQILNLPAFESWHILILEPTSTGIQEFKQGFNPWNIPALLLAHWMTAFTQ